MPEHGNKHRKFCSHECLIRQWHRVTKSHRRARQRAVRYESIDPIIVFNRDGWRCHLCGVKTPARLRGKRVATAPEMDHIIPLAVGGTHTYANVACACRKCNQDKGPAVRGQMRIF